MFEADTSQVSLCSVDAPYPAKCTQGRSDKIEECDKKEECSEGDKKAIMDEASGKRGV